MIITLTQDIQEALAKEARRQGTTSEALVLEMLKTKFVLPQPAQLSLEARDEWEAMVLGVRTECGVSLSHEAVSSEGLYE